MKCIQNMVKVSVMSALVLVAGCSQTKAPSSTGMAGMGSMDARSDFADSQGAQTQGLGNSVSYRTDVNGRVINPMEAPANQTYYFGFDQSAVKGSDLDALRIQANYLAAHPQASVRLEGNTDQRGSREYNVALGWRRDQAVQRILAQAGVHSDQIEMVSFGKERPAVLGNDAMSWSLNRRVNLVYKER